MVLIPEMIRYRNGSIKHQNEAELQNLMHDIRIGHIRKITRAEANAMWNDMVYDPIKHISRRKIFRFDVKGPSTTGEEGWFAHNLPDNVPKKYPLLHSTGFLLICG